MTTSKAKTTSLSSVIQYSLFFGIFFKLITFVFNQLLIKFVPPSLLLFNSYLEFLVNSIIFFAGEGIRLACQRIPHSSQKNVPGKVQSGTIGASDQEVINLSYVSLLLGLPISIGLIYLQRKSVYEYFATNESPFLVFGVIFVVMVTAMISLGTEPYYNLATFKGLYKVRTQSESYGLIANCLFNFTSIATISHFYGTNLRIFNNSVILAFALGRLVNSLVVFMIYYACCPIDEGSTVLAQKICQETTKNHYYLEPRALEYWKSVFLQLVFKNFLTEGDKYIINWFFSLTQQGFYAIIANYGSLVARLVFNPIEESFKLYTSNSLAGSNNNAVPVQNALLVLAKGYAYLSLVLIIFGYSNAQFLAQFLFTKVIRVSWWNENLLEVTMIPTYVLYLPFLAINGICEGLFANIATRDQIQSYSVYMFVCSVTFFATCYYFIEVMKLNLNGLVFANIINMALRIGYCLLAIHKFFRNNITIKVSPNRVINNFGIFIEFSLFIFSVQRFALKSTSSFSQLVRSASLGVIYLCAILYNEKETLIPSMNKYFKRKTN